MAKRQQVPEIEAEHENKGAEFSSLAVDVPKATGEPKALYWFGTLPLSPGEKRRVSLSTDIYDDRDVELTAEEAWFPGLRARNLNRPDEANGPRIWIGKCAYYQSIPVTGLTFPAWTEVDVGEAVNEGQRIRIAWPGAIERFSEKQIEKILEGVKSRVIRMQASQEDARKRIAYIVNLKRGHLSRPVDPENPLTRPAPGMNPEQMERGDIPVAEYVYMGKLDADPSTPMDQFYRLVPSMERFFKTPPSMLANVISEEPAGAKI